MQLTDWLDGYICGLCVGAALAGVVALGLVFLL